MLTSKVLDYQFGADTTYLAVLTYGPASMALLDMMQKEGVKPIICYVNYHIDQASEDAEQALRLYAQQHDLQIEVCDTNFVSKEGQDEDYHLWQRNTRYNFFEEMYKKHNAGAIFIAHIQDDILETYLITKADGIKNTKYGVSKISTYHNMIVIRPLLDFTRDDLRKYDVANNVPFSDLAAGNEAAGGTEVRRKIESLNEVERDQLLSQMARENAEKINFIRDIDASIKQVNELEIRAIMALSDDEFATTLIDFVNHKSPVHVSFSPSLIAAVRKMCIDKKENMSLQLKGSIYLVKEYDILTLDLDGLDMPYSYVLDKPQKFSCESFDLDFTNGAEDRNIHLEDYPLTVRSVLPQDAYSYGGYLVPIKKMLSAAGCSPRLMHIWPVFLNKDGHIIYVPRYKKGFSEYHTSVLNIHVKTDEK
jgi:tRNA(Ile)-lysidine synthetase-like protein